MEFILVGLNVVLEVNLDLVVHLWADVLQEQGRNNTHYSKRHRGQCHISAKVSISIW